MVSDLSTILHGFGNGRVRKIHYKLSKHRRIAFWWFVCGTGVQRALKRGGDPATPGTRHGWYTAPLLLYLFWMPLVDLLGIQVAFTELYSHAGAYPNHEAEIVRHRPLPLDAPSICMGHLSGNHRTVHAPPRRPWRPIGRRWRRTSRRTRRSSAAYRRCGGHFYLRSSAELALLYSYIMYLFSIFPRNFFGMWSPVYIYILDAPSISMGHPSGVY
eukprot:COSAG05_NODE_548_length_8749_cov_33.055838_12_plen_215_part_00